MKDVFLFTKDKGHFSDNFFDVLPNQTKTVHFTLTEDALGFYDDDGNFTVQPGEFSIYVGGDSTANLTTKFNL